MSNNVIRKQNADGSSEIIDKIPGIIVSFHGKNNNISFHEHTKFQNCILKIMGNNNNIAFGKTKYQISNIKVFSGNNTILSIGDDFSCWGAEFRLDEDGTQISIGNDCMLSSEIYFYPTDGHAIFDIENKELLNKGENISIGNHVWIGKRVCFLKGSKICDNSVIGFGSLVNSVFTEKNLLIAGCKADIIRKNIDWKRENPCRYTKSEEKNNIENIHLSSHILSIDYINPDQSFIQKFNSENKNWFIGRRPYRDTQERLENLQDAPYRDYVRYRILGLCAEEITARNIAGSVAEAGVFRGEFATVLNRLFPNKKLFLYDTFEGFSEQDIEHESDPAQTRQTSWYKQINTLSEKYDLIDLVKKNLPNPEQAIFRKGYFPDSATPDEKEKFCLVSIDMDIYAPTLAALKFFWPRMTPGGYIFMHDGKFPGVQQAIEEFRATVGILPIIPICDLAETYIICKI